MGKVNLEGRSLSRLAIDPNVTARLPDYAVDGRKPKPGAFARTLSSEKGIEDARHHLMAHACPGVAYRKHDVLARSHSHVASGICIIERHIISGSGGCLLIGKYFAASDHLNYK